MGQYWEMFNSVKMWICSYQILLKLAGKFEKYVVHAISMRFPKECCSSDWVINLTYG